MAVENLELQRIIQQVVFQTKMTELQGTFLHLIVDSQPVRFPDPGGFQTSGNFIDGKPHHRGFVEIIQHLAEDAVGVDHQTFEIAFLEQWADDLGQIVLRGFQRQKLRRSGRVLETGIFAQHGPEQGNTSLCQTAHSEQVDVAAGKLSRVQQLSIGNAQTALRQQDQDVFTGNPRLQQRLQAGYPRRCFAASGWSAQKERCNGIEPCNGLLFAG